MSDVKTSRPFQERLLDGFDRSQLRQEVQKVKPRRLQGLRRKYATFALGASLAFAGLGVPVESAASVPLQVARTGAPAAQVDHGTGAAAVLQYADRSRCGLPIDACWHGAYLATRYSLLASVEYLP
jgi:hypothetical protein